MSEESLDAESVTRSKNTGPESHLRHLLRVGYSFQSPLVRAFVEEHSLQRLVKELQEGGEYNRK